jgi:hypothetical protein
MLDTPANPQAREGRMRKAILREPVRHLRLLRQ